MLGFALVAAAIVVGAVVADLLLQPGLPLDLRGVSFSSNPAAPGETLTVTAQIQGGTLLAPLSVDFWYTPFFGNGPTGGGSVLHHSGEAYSQTIGPFSNGTAVWVVVSASDGRSLQVSANNTLVVGSVLQDGASGIRINSVTLQPPQPNSLDNPTLTVNVTSSAALSGVWLESTYFYAAGGGVSSGAGGGTFPPDAHGNYTTMPWFGLVGGGVSYGTSVGTRWFYRVGAQDSTGNAVLSPVYNFTVALPPL